MMTAGAPFEVLSMVNDPVPFTTVNVPVAAAPAIPPTLSVPKMTLVFNCTVSPPAARALVRLAVSPRFVPDAPPGTPGMVPLDEVVQDPVEL